MQFGDDRILFSASDLVNFMGCTHATFLDLRQLTEPVTFDEDDAHTVLLQEKGMEHERAYLERLRSEGRSIAGIDGDSLAEKAAATREAMARGVDVVYQGTFLDLPWMGYSDFLLRVERPSDFGDFSYEVADTKLARTANPSTSSRCASTATPSRRCRTSPPNGCT